MLTLETKKMKNYIKNKNKNKFEINSVKVIIKDEIEETSSNQIKSALKKAISKIPRHLLGNLDAIYIGQFPDLKKRELQAMYKNSAVFMTNKHKNPEHMIDDLVHEIAHSVEETHEKIIYFDKKLEKEFIQKRKALWKILKDQGFDVELDKFLNPEYDQILDMKLYKEIGYTALSMFSNQIFYSPYASTSLREYFATGFEAFFMKEEIYKLQKISPILFKKIKTLLHLEK